MGHKGSKLKLRRYDLQPVDVQSDLSTDSPAETFDISFDDWPVIVCAGCDGRVDEVFSLPCNIVACASCIQKQRVIDGDRLRMCFGCKRPHIEPEGGFPSVKPSLVYEVEDQEVEDGEDSLPADTESRYVQAKGIINGLQSDWTRIYTEAKNKLSIILENASPAELKAADKQLETINTEINDFFSRMLQLVKQKVLKSLYWLKKKVEGMWQSVKAKFGALFLKFREPAEKITA